MSRTIDTLVNRFPFLKQAPSTILDKISTYGVVRTFDPDTRIYWKGDSCTHIAFIFDGEIRVFKCSDTGREITLYEIGPGETCILNASSILAGMKYPAEATTLTGVRALMIPAEIFRELVDNYAFARSFVFNQLSQRLVLVFELLEDVVFGKLDRRLMDYLIEKNENNKICTTHKTIAQDLGSSREVITRLLKDMERNGLIKTGRGSIELLGQ